MTGPERGAFGPRVCVAAGLRLCGARPVQLRPSDPTVTEGLDGVVVTGGHDIEPVLYAQAAEVEGRYDRERDAFESALIRAALQRDLPILGICRGAQLLNVCLGGTLEPDLRKRRRHTSNRRTIFPLKTLLVEAGANLGRVLGGTRLRINSLHHQAIERTGDGLDVAGRDLDGIVQAVEAPERTWTVGVQWHPEFLLYLRAQRRLFAGLVEAARSGARLR